MSKKEELRKLLKAYTHKTQEPVLPYSSFRSLLDKYLERYGGELKELAAVRNELDMHLPALLGELQEEWVVEVVSNPDGSKTIRYLEYYRDLIEKRYRIVQTRPETPFPSEQTFPIVFPADLVIPVEAKKELVPFLEKGEDQPPRILRLLFPELSKSILITTALLERTLLEISLQKIRQYLRDQKNATYIQHKLVPLFRGKERILKDQMINVVTKPDMILQDLMNPTDFIYQFWSQTTSFLLKELTDKKDKLEEENDLAIAAHLIGAYSIFYKGKTTKEKETEAALKYLAGYFEKSPYVYTFHDIFNFKDSKGFPLTKKIDNASLQQFLDRRTTPADDRSLPEIIRVKTIDKKEYFISRIVVAKFLLERSFSLFREIRSAIIEEWYEALEADEKRKEFKDPKAFEEYVVSVLKRLDPLFYSLLNFSLLFLILEQVPINPTEKEFLETVLDRKGKSIQPVTKIFRLHPEDLLAEAKLRLPFWKTIPVLKQIVQFFLRLYTLQPKQKKPKKSTEATAMTLGAAGEVEEEIPAEQPSTSDSRARKVKFQKSIEALKARYVGPKANLQREMQDLVDLWNTLLDPTAKANLVEDVNSLVRDFLRKLKILQRYQAPTPERLERLAEELVSHEALQKIRNKEALRKYILLYMLEVLGKAR
ncbi:MAG: hypothetical protein Kow009_15910 [Spirochaetales bacterium]